MSLSLVMMPKVVQKKLVKLSKKVVILGAKLRRTQAMQRCNLSAINFKTRGKSDCSVQLYNV
jgi:hypothetical protein